MFFVHVVFGFPAPTYRVDRENMFTGIEGHDGEHDTKITQDMVAPIYAAGENEKMAMNHFKEVVMHAEMIRLMQGMYNFLYI